MNVNWLRVGTGVLSGIFLMFVFWGAYRFYFDKPIPVVNNQTFAEGSNPVIKQGSESKGGWSAGLVAGPLYLDGKLGGFLGSSITYRF